MSTTFSGGAPRPRSAAVRRVLLAVAILSLLAIAWLALSGGVRQIPRSRTPGQRVETAVQLAGGLLSVLTVITCSAWPPGRRPALIAWAASLTAAAGLSSLVWGPPLPAVGLLFAAVTLLVALAIIWLLHAGLAASTHDVIEPQRPDGGT